MQVSILTLVTHRRVCVGPYCVFVYFDVYCVVIMLHLSLKALLFTHFDGPTSHNTACSGVRLLSAFAQH